MAQLTSGPSHVFTKYFFTNTTPQPTQVRHRLDDDRAAAYDTLLAAEAKATTEKKGVHSAKVSVIPLFLVVSSACVPSTLWLAG